MMDFVDACLLGPVGAAVLADLERGQRDDVPMFELPPDSQPEAVASAVHYVQAMTFGDLCAVAVNAGDWIVGPWVPDAAESSRLALEFAEQRRPIAAAISERFDIELHRPIDGAYQEWWTSPPADHPVVDAPRLFADFDRVYGGGEFTWAGLWTTNETPSEAHDDLIGAWEIFPGPVSRLRLAVNQGVSVFEIHRPDDWVDLVTRCGIESRHRRADANSGESDAVRMVPDWAAIADSYDAVHLSWAGFITTHHRRIELDDGSFTMLRHWWSERTHWLRDCFGDPEPMEAAGLTGRMSEIVGIDTRQDRARAVADVEIFDRLLGR